MGRPAPTMIVRLERLKRRIEAMDLSEDEIKQLEREQRALSMQINYRKRSKMTRSKILQMADEMKPVIYKIPDVFEVKPIENDVIKNRKWG